ncbi:branched-chain amino acid transport system II carrier protein [Sutterella massiliensis]|uniref:Branched-chain amino acid transport system carrier protein n=1 Tax=Sutterella massiliensis TaxID=1816689 RepID=A0ABS2DTD7_9BURK|nr:branched-chain amino acid transport system II carrier protein [Sutterella massiliensis]MBM6704533.1 branched-chain amino acid transport system II carrier protein [Sutterella massiliensis]
MNALSALSFSQRLLVGLTLFSMFFGAGNLIFPPFLGAQAGTDMPAALAGFLVTAVGFPILGVMAVAESGGLTSLASRVNARFAFLFTLLIYLSIGPCLAIPRTASTSFEMVMRPALESAGLLEASFGGFGALVIAQFVYSVLFFLVAYFVALNPEKLTQRLGKYLCPALIVLIFVLFLGILFHPLGEAAAPGSAYVHGAFATGFIEGYQTMDTIAALNFGLVIAMNIRAFGIKSEGAVVKETVLAGAIAACVFFAVYGALAYIGAQAGGAYSGMENGAQTLTLVAADLFGPVGTVLMGLIFFIACLNTCVGLISCCSNYFSETFPVLDYRGWAKVFAFASMVIANAGLTLILKFSVPLLVAIYPVAIVLIVLGLLSLASRRLLTLRAFYPATIVMTGIFSVLAGIEAFGIRVPVLSDFADTLPFTENGLEWMLPALIGAILGAALSAVLPKKSYEN